jgi:hypothetical protein
MGVCSFLCFIIFFFFFFFYFCTLSIASVLWFRYVVIKAEPKKVYDNSGDGFYGILLVLVLFLCEVLE